MSDLRFVFKYPLDPVHGGQHAMPPGARFLDLQVQAGTPVMWWSVPRVTPDRSEWRLRTFAVVPTGGPGYADGPLHYVGTFQLDGLVGHVYGFEPVDREGA